MEDIITTIINLEPYALASIGLIVCLITFVLIDKIISIPSKQDKEDQPTALIEPEDVHNYTTIFSEKEIIEEPQTAEQATSQPTTLQECLDLALREDLLNNRQAAANFLSQAPTLSNDPKMKVRLNVLLKKYSTTNFTLNELTDMYFGENKSEQTKSPSIISENNPTTTKQEALTSQNVQKSEVNQEEQITPTPQPLEKEETVSTTADNVSIETNKDECSDNLEAQIALLSQSKNQVPATTTNNEVLPCHDVWANYMCFDNGRMNLKNSFIHLENPWGSVSSIAELQDRISEEILSSSGDKKEWAMVSVIPFHAPKF